MVLKNEIAYIIDLMRSKGNVTVTNGTFSYEVPCNVVFDCDKCLKASDLDNGVHSWYSEEPYFYFGNKYEVERILSLKDKKHNQSDRIKYPAIILEMPFKENFDDFDRVNSTMRILFATKTESALTYEQRYEQNFEAILIPMFEAFKTAMQKAENVDGFNIKSKTDIPYFGEKAVVSSDLWDVIDTQFEINFINNCKKNKLCQ